MEERKKRTRIRRKNSGIKKLILLLILLFIIIQLIIKVIVPNSVTLARYVYSAVRNYYLSSKEFYFNSDKLSENTAHFESDNWSGVDEYAVEININTRKNLNEFSKVDVNYNLQYEYGIYKSDGTKYEGDVLDFKITDMAKANSEGIISETIEWQNENNQDTIEFSVQPKITLENDDYVFVKITATSTSPYVTKLTGEFKIIIGSLGMSYKIEDEKYDPYCEVIVTNTLDYYIVDTAFGSYSAGDSITITEYLALDDADKEKCHSMIITLEFNPEDVRLDTTSGVYLIADYVGYQTINSYQYVNEIQFKMDAEESRVVKFYKVVAEDDYTYPTGADGELPIVTVTPS